MKRRALLLGTAMGLAAQPEASGRPCFVSGQADAVDGGLTSTHLFTMA